MALLQRWAVIALLAGAVLMGGCGDSGDEQAAVEADPYLLDPELYRTEIEAV